MEPGARRLKWILLPILSIISNCMAINPSVGRNDFNWVALAARASTLGGGVSIYVFLRVHNLNMLVFDLLSSSAQ